MNVTATHKKKSNKKTHFIYSLSTDNIRGRHIYTMLNVETILLQILIKQKKESKSLWKQNRPNINLYSP